MKKYKLSIYQLIFEEEINAEDENKAWELLSKHADKNGIDSGDTDYWFEVEEVENEDEEEEEENA